MSGWCLKIDFKDCPKIRNLPKIFLRSFENVAPGELVSCRSEAILFNRYITLPAYTCVLCIYNRSYL